LESDPLSEREPPPDSALPFDSEPAFDSEPPLVSEPLFDSDARSLDEPDSVDVEPPAPSPPERALDDRVPLDDPEERSFFAQPDPLKCTAGLLKPFRIVPSAPHSGQKRGPWSLIP
jgi:hypothetical protein